MMTMMEKGQQDQDKSKILSKSKSKGRWKEVKMNSKLFNKRKGSAVIAEEEEPQEPEQEPSLHMEDVLLIQEMTLANNNNNKEQQTQQDVAEKPSQSLRTSVPGTALIDERLENLHKFLLSNGNGNANGNNNNNNIINNNSGSNLIRRTLSNGHDSMNTSMASIENEGIEDLQRDLQEADQHFQQRRRGSAGSSSLASNLVLEQDEESIKHDDQEEEKKEEEEEEDNVQMDPHQQETNKTVDNDLQGNASSSSISDSSTSNSGDSTTPMPPPSSPSISVRSDDSPLPSDPELFHDEQKEQTPISSIVTVPTMIATNQEKSQQAMSWNKIIYAMVFFAILILGAPTPRMWMEPPKIESGNVVYKQETIGATLITYVASVTTRKRRGRYRRNSRMLVVDRRP